MEKEGRVLSLQSHVVSGYVGNKSATFPLQVLGLEVDAINSVQFSNHTGYGHVKGQVMNAQELEDLLEGLRLNGLSIGRYSHLLTGYIGSQSFLKAVQKIVSNLKKDNPGLTYVCDPVMGDNGAMYVPAELLPIYRDNIVPLADIITPNQYEAELLSEMEIKTEADVGPVLDWFHEKGVQTVVLSSTELGDDDNLIGIASARQPDGSCTRLRVAMPRLPARFTGTGDLFAALLLGWLHRTGHDLKQSVENTVATMQGILTATYKHATSVAPESGELSPGSLELRLVQCLDLIRQPQVVITASPMS